jgi:microcin C transport system permease protein
MDATTAHVDEVELKPKKPSRLSGINQRRLQLFKANRRGYWSFWIFLFLFIASLAAEFIANDRPIIASYKGEILLPVFNEYPESKFGGFLARTDFRDPFIQEEVNNNGWMIWPAIRYSYQTVNNELPSPAPSPPAFLLSKEDACKRYEKGVEDVNCVFGNMNWLGTDDQGRDVIARLIYGFRISVLFGLVLTVLSSIVGVAAGAVQGYFGGWTDLLFQRFIEIWTSIPTLYLLIILAAFLTPNFWLLLGIMLLFSWTALVGVVRAEIPARAQLRVRPGSTRAGPERPQDHVQAPVAKRHGGDGHLHAVHPVRLGDHAYRARLPGLRPAAGFAFAGRTAGSGARPTCKRPGWG